MIIFIILKQITSVKKNLILKQDMFILHIPYKILNLYKQT